MKLIKPLAKTAEVAVIGALKETLIYSVPERLAPLLKVGQGVIVPLQKEKRAGIIWELDPDYQKTFELRPISEILDSKPLLTPEIIALLRWASAYYFAPPGEAARLALPPGRFAPPTMYIKRIAKAVESFELKAESGTKEDRLIGQILSALEDDKHIVLEALAKKLSKSVNLIKPRLLYLEQEGFVKISRESKMGVAPPKLNKALAITEAGKKALAEEAVPKNAHAQRAALEFLAKREEASLAELNKLLSSASSTVKRLIECGFVEAILTEKDRRTEPRPLQKPEFELNPKQAEALETILKSLDKGGFQTFLLFGITGSGKTEVYLRAAETALEKGGGVIMLVPEIALTSNLSRQAAARFGDMVRVMHSGLSAGERADAWRRIMSGEAKVVIGPRSAVFAPVQNLRLIIVDEEHDSSYKQDDSIRYNGAHLALVRANLQKITCVLGSATPSIESFYQAKTGKYKLLELPERVEKRPMPGIDLVDLRGTKFSPMFPLSERLEKAFIDTLSRREQSILYMNRRGFAYFLICADCGRSFSCPNCAVSLVYHHDASGMKCHYCGHEEPTPKVCPSCSSENVKHLGIGIERVEEYIRQRMKTARIARLDRDSITRKEQLEEILAAMEERRVDVLLGTQMVAKGHDFPGVTLVGIVAADIGMNLPDFRAAERLFQLLTQVSGRAGRGNTPGKVVLQTFSPKHYAIKSAVESDFIAFYEKEIEIRKRVQYPPFSRLCLIRCEAEAEQDARFAIQTIAETYRQSRTAGSWLLGPIASPINKLRSKYRFQCLLKARNQKTREEIVYRLKAFAAREIPANIKVIFDIDPVNML